MASPKKVSIVIVTYNHAAFIEDTIRSILGQTYENIEIIVTDDGSTDGNQDTIRRLAGQHHTIIPVFSDDNKGIARNVNRGLARCSGEYIAIFGGDDLMLPDKISKQVEFLRAHPECVMCTHDMEVFNSRTGAMLYRWSDRFDMRDGGPEVMLGTNWFLGRPVKYLPSAHMVRAAAAPASGCDERLRFACDWLYDIVTLTRGRVGYLPEVLGRYRRHDKQMSTSEEAREVFHEEVMMVLGIVAARHPELAGLIRRKRTFCLFQNLVFEWIRPEKRRDCEAQLRTEAGYATWLYMRLVRYLLAHRGLLEASRPWRGLVKRIVGDIDGRAQRKLSARTEL